MPFKSEKQRKWMHTNDPEMAKKWEKEKKMKQKNKVRELIVKLVREVMKEDGIKLKGVKEASMEKEKIPSDLKRFMDRFIDKLQDKKLTRSKQKAILYKVVKGLGISPQELMMYVQRVKKGLGEGDTLDREREKQRSEKERLRVQHHKDMERAREKEKNMRQEESFAGSLNKEDRKNFDKMRQKQSEVLGYKLAGTPDFKVEIDDATKHSNSIDETKKRDYKAEYKKYGSSTKAKKYRAELNAYNRKKGTYGNGDKKDASHKNGKIVGFEEQSKNRGRAEKSRLKKEETYKFTKDEMAKLHKDGKLEKDGHTYIFSEGKLTEKFDSYRWRDARSWALDWESELEGKLNEKFDLKKLEDAIKMFQQKIKKQGRVTNARDEQHLKQLIKVYKDMGGRKIKEGKGVDKVLSMANDNSFGKLGGKTVDAMSANLFKTVYDKLNDANKVKIDKMNEKQLYVFMTKLWTKFGKQVRI